MTMMEKINEIFPLHIPKPNFVCKVHEDNQSCIKMATGTKSPPKTNHIAILPLQNSCKVWTGINSIHTDK